MNFSSLGVEISVDRSKTWLALAGRNWRKELVVELLDPFPGTDATERIADLWLKQKLDQIVIDPRSASSTLLPPLKGEGFTPLEVDARQLAAAHGNFLDFLTAGKLKYKKHEALSAAMRAAGERPLAGSRAIDRRAGDAAPLVAAELAVYGVADDAEGLAPDQVTVSWL